MSASPFDTKRHFLTPAFQIKLKGQDTGREVISDVLEVSFTDDLANIDSFEFVLHDWDAIALRPKYSSPWDKDGKPLKLSEGGADIPNFEPGVQVSLYMGYLEDGELPLIMEGEVISISPSFPASGPPTCRIRALNSFLRNMQKIRVEDNYSGTPKAIVDKLCQENNIKVEWATLDSEGEPTDKVEIEGILYDEIAKRAQEYGLSIFTTVNSLGESVLSLKAPFAGGDTPVVDFVWGRSLISFAPVLSVKGQVSAVVARGGDPTAEGDEQNLEAKKTWSDIGLSPTALGPAGTADLENAVPGLIEVIKPDGITTKLEAEDAALAHLRELAAELITGSGTSIGLPSLRAGKTITIASMGERFNGTYRVKQTTHSIGGSGYTTSFQVRKEVLENG